MSMSSDGQVVMTVLLCVLAGLSLLLFLLWMRERDRAVRSAADLENARRDAENERLRAEKVEELSEMLRLRMSEDFSELSRKSLEHLGRQFMSLAKSELETQQVQAQGSLEKKEMAIRSLLDPVGQSLEKVHAVMAEIEKERKENLGSLRENLAQMRQSHVELVRETSKLSSALHSRSARGRWGELQLRRIVELAGMVEHCDFETQVSVKDERAFRPDMVVNLPGGRCVVIDAKVPMDAYLLAMEAASPEEQAAHLAQHAKQVRAHQRALADKRYFAMFDNTPEFVVMFLPGESLLHAAMEADPALFEQCLEGNVVMATPSTLIALLKAVAYGWRQEQLALGAKAISEQGSKVYDSCLTFLDNLGKLGTALKSSVTHYNNAIGTAESRLLPRARKLAQMGVAAKSKAEDKALLQVDVPVRSPQVPDEGDAE